MKTFISVLIIIAVLGVTVAFLHVVGKKPVPVAPVTGTYPNTPTVPDPDSLSPDVNASQLCYIWNTEDGSKAMLSMDVRDQNVIGEFHWLPAEKDKKVGIFTGTITPRDLIGKRIVNAFWNTSAEGMTATEELKIIVGDSVATPAFGEMKDRGDGTYVYADPSKLDYSINLQQTGCGDSAMD
ncbi:MAG: hypothetical protein WDN09_02085 [bacterium]